MLTLIQEISNISVLIHNIDAHHINVTGREHYLKVPKRENFSIAFFAQSEPIWIGDVGTAKKTNFFIN